MLAGQETLADREHVRATLGLRPDIADAAAPLLLDWAEQRAQEIAVGLRWASCIAVTWQLPGGLAEPTLRRRGWAPVRRYNHLQGDLLHPAPKVPAAPPGAVVHTVTTDQQARQVHDVLETAMAELARRGCTRVGLDVDTGNQSGALRLYESAGLEAAYQADQWRLTTPASA